MPIVLRLSALLLCTLPLIACNNADRLYWNWNNGWDHNFSFNYISVDPARGGDPDAIDPNDFTGADLDTYSVADNPGVFYRSLDIAEGTRVMLVVWPPDSDRPVVISRGVSSSDASVMTTSEGMTVRIVMFWYHRINWEQLAQQHGYGTYGVGWYWNDEREASALHRFELVP